MSEIDTLLSAVQAADVLGVSRQRVLAIAKTGSMGRKIGSTYVFTRAEIEAYRDRPKQPHGTHPKQNADQPTALVTSA
ncbi:MAG: hypothetical protein NVS2B4_20750 [Ramlibacter sp.]